MDKSIYFIKNEDLLNLVEKLYADYQVFVPFLKDSSSLKKDYCYQRFKPGLSWVLNPYRVTEPLKTFFTYPREELSGYFCPDKRILNVEQKTIVLGVKACDIAAHRIQDFVFIEGVQEDALYRLRRENTLLVSSDCTDYKDVCFCLAMDVLPYPQKLFDLNLSSLNEGYLVEIGSPRAGQILEDNQSYFTPAKDTQIAARKSKRDIFVDKLKNHIIPQNMPRIDKLQDLIRKGFSLDTWSHFMLTCVECGGCNLICDTCHCFLLWDEKGKTNNLRLRQWDACQYANFSRVAGGANPLKNRTQRLRNRFIKKFDFFIDNLGIPACCGCGRCIEVCPGKIDIREVLKDLAKKV
ncbi:MAG: 4Fe-4S dicluster domain-containing protein [Candidatus Omnitrophota bacterium]|nr:4Fe-4S dicluster domain-containing protein [Candidatus Omnitrophota bacterium]